MCTEIQAFLHTFALLSSAFGPSALYLSMSRSTHNALFLFTGSDCNFKMGTLSALEHARKIDNALNAYVAAESVAYVTASVFAGPDAMGSP